MKFFTYISDAKRNLYETEQLQYTDRGLLRGDRVTYRRYQFYEGKPWRYGLLTAPSDFPIYKTDDEVKAEKDSVLRKFEPYYRMNPDIQKQEVEKLRANYNNGNNLRSKVSPAYMQYIESSLINLYKNGIISSQDLDELRKEEYSRVNLLENAVAQPRYVSDFFTVRTAAGQIDPAIV